MAPYWARTGGLILVSRVLKIQFLLVAHVKVGRSHSGSHACVVPEKSELRARLPKKECSFHIDLERCMDGIDHWAHQITA